MSNYIIAASPRTGSNWLCHWLRSCNAGTPREYLERYDHDWFAHMWRASANGVLAVKIFWHHIAKINLHPAAYLNAHARLMEPLQWVFLDRKDKLRQAVSLQRVWAGGTWSQCRGERVDIPLEYNRQGIDNKIRYLQLLADNWRNYFQSRGIAPLEITYEDMCADEHGTVKRVLAHIGVGGFHLVEARFQKQAGEDVERMVRMYMEDGDMDGYSNDHPH